MILDGKFCFVVTVIVCLSSQVQASVNCFKAGRGRHADTNDVSCRSYTLCDWNNPSRTYYSYNYTCPKTSLFNPSTRKCTYDYICNVNNTNITHTSIINTSIINTSIINTSISNTNISNTNISRSIPTVSVSGHNFLPYDPSDTTSLCTDPGWYANPILKGCDSFLVCASDGTGGFEEDIDFCPSETFFNPLTACCEKNYHCHIPYNCTGLGKFRNPNDDDCRSYVMCVLATNSSNKEYYDYYFICPGSTLFDPENGLCTYNYACRYN